MENSDICLGDAHTKEIHANYTPTLKRGDQYSKRSWALALLCGPRRVVLIGGWEETVLI